jgi:hypothetical protein
MWGFWGHAAFVIFGPYGELANSATSRGSVRQVYRIRESHQFSAVLTVHQNDKPVRRNAQIVPHVRVTRL